MKRRMLVLLVLLITNLSYAENTALAPVLEGSVVIDEYPNSETPEYLDYIELQPQDNAEFKSCLLKNINRYEVKYEDNKNDVFYQDGKFSILGISNKGYDNDTLTNNLRQRAEIKYSKKYFEVSGGYLTKYQTANLNNSKQSFYLNNTIKTGTRFSLALGNYISPRNKEYYQEIGINYRAKYIKGANFSVLGGATFKEGSEPSQVIRFNTDFYFK